MVGGDHFRPEPKRRAPDPSLEEMLRRARDAPLGDDIGHSVPQVPSFRPIRTRRWGHRAAAQGYLLFWTGILVGALVGYLTARAAIGAGRDIRPSQPVVVYVPATAITAPPTPTDTPLPTPTDTPVPPPTAVLTSSPVQYPTGNMVGMAKAYYDQHGPYVGVDILEDVTGLAIQSQDSTQLTVCIAFDIATVAAPDTATGWGIRTFTLAPDSAGTWSVVQMGSPSSCSLN